MPSQFKIAAKVLYPIGKLILLKYNFNKINFPVRYKTLSLNGKALITQFVQEL